MNRYKANGVKTVDSLYKVPGKTKWNLKDKLLLGLTPWQYIAQAVRNPFNWILAAIFAVGLPLIAIRFIFGLASVTHSSYDYPWGLFLTFGLFGMVPLSSSGFMLGTTVEIFGRHDFEPIERLALLNGLLGYLFAVVYLLVDLGQPWRLPYPMVVAYGPAAVLFLVGWHVATYLSVQVCEVSVAFFEWIGFPVGKQGVRKITLGLTVAGIILSTLHQGALGALFNYAPGKVHPLWYSSAFQWLHFFVSSIPGGLCMVIVVSTIVRKTMAWRCDDNFIDNLDKLTISLAKGASMGLITYLAIKLMGVAHDNKWEYLATGWGVMVHLRNGYRGHPAAHPLRLRHQKQAGGTDPLHRLSHRLRRGAQPVEYRPDHLQLEAGRAGDPHLAGSDHLRHPLLHLHRRLALHPLPAADPLYLENRR